MKWLYKDENIKITPEYVFHFINFTLLFPLMFLVKKKNYKIAEVK